jgi:hypothetical protein
MLEPKYHVALAHDIVAADLKLLTVANSLRPSATEAWKMAHSETVRPKGAEVVLFKSEDIFAEVIELHLQKLGLPSRPHN